MLLYRLSGLAVGLSRQVKAKCESEGGLHLSDSVVGLFERNIKLTHFVVNKLKSLFPEDELEDVRSVARVGLWKACLTYNNDRDTTFSTYAIKVIRNEVLLYYRSNRAQYYNVALSLDEEVTDKNGKCWGETRGAYIADAHTIDDVIGRLHMDEIKSKCSPITQAYLGGMTQVNIAKKHGITQSYVSRLIKKDLKKALAKLGIRKEGIKECIAGL